jgi:hypothetical protein
MLLLREGMFADAPSRSLRDSTPVRSATEIRTKLLADLKSMLDRPGMYGVEQHFELAVRSRLQDLAFVDDVGGQLDHLFRTLETDGCFGALGAWGALADAMGSSACTDQVASIYARIAAALGFFEPARRLTPDEWARAVAAESWAKGGIRRADVEALLGTPSYRTQSRHPRVLAYAGSTDNAWLYVDLGQQAEENPPVEFLRLPRAPFSRSVVSLRPSEGLQPEDAYREFLLATLTADRAALDRLTVRHEDHRALSASGYPPDVAQALSKVYRDMAVMRVSAPDDVVYVASEALPMPLAVVKVGSTWKVDADPLVREWARRSYRKEGAN